MRWCDRVYIAWIGRCHSTKPWNSFSAFPARRSPTSEPSSHEPIGQPSRPSVRDLATEGIGDCRAAATVRYVDEPHASQLAKMFSGQVSQMSRYLRSPRSVLCCGPTRLAGRGRVPLWRAALRASSARAAPCRSARTSVRHSSEGPESSVRNSEHAMVSRMNPQETTSSIEVP